MVDRFLESKSKYESKYKQILLSKKRKIKVSLTFLYPVEIFIAWHKISVLKMLLMSIFIGENVVLIIICIVKQ